MMMYLIEVFFDISYLCIILGLGFRLLLENNRDAKKFALMTLILGLGDGAHLLPRIVSNLTVNGFEKYVFFLSWGEFVTSITMTFFYLLFYDYYKKISGDNNRNKTIAIYFLAAIRIICVLLPQNLWSSSGNYLFSIIRNIPFAIMGLVLIIWTFKFRKKEGLENVSLLITASFICYLPVVALSRFFPLFGLLMIPKTVAYVLLVLRGFQYFIKDFEVENILKDSVVFLIMGLLGGVFYREFTKTYSWEEFTSLGLVHTHLMVLGFLFLLIFYILVKNDLEKIYEFKKPLVLYISGLTWTIISLILRGIYTITSPSIIIFPDSALSGLAGIGHLMLGFGIIWLVLKLLKREVRYAKV
ncbi:DUF2871 domain-containing protein [Peptoniphilus raoultii]|uniref:DUF2871 domain-containing protein n=1 Tax=Peptoniphilus raoultii TaxID=1776387 RepID=UPI000A93FECE|nr:DUF2871 domain-containing protein [Peptoniphilus raoultii]